MIFTVICITCKDHIIIRSASSLLGVVKIDDKSLGVNLVCFTNCYRCDPIVEKTKVSVPIYEVEKTWMNLIKDLYNVVTLTMRLSYCLVQNPNTSPTRWMSTLMPMVWQVEWDFWLISHENLRKSLDEIMFTLTKVKDDV
ncbi:hypothetical protein CDV55_100645 [Aspergillus turcosus]|nr:hypothetical protein CDV55_100645 [Aspergillus turcosus]